MLSVNMSNIAIITVNVLVIAVFFMTLANLMQLIYQEILGLMIVGICKVHAKGIYIKNQVFDYSWKKQKHAKVKLYYYIDLSKRINWFNFERLKNALIYIKNNLICSDDNMYLTVDSLIVINNIKKVIK